jgi:mRNA interferase MazF
VKRGDLYRVSHPGHDPKKFRVFVVVSRQAVIDSNFSTVVCAPIYTVYDGLASQVVVGVEEGLKHDSSVHCDELVSLPKTMLTHYIGMLSSKKMDQLDRALAIALDLPD